MINEKDKTHAEASYLSNVFSFIGTGEGRKLSALEVMHIKQNYPTVDKWYAALGQAGRPGTAVCCSASGGRTEEGQ